MPRQTLAHVGRRRLILDGFKRMRYSDGFSHARSLAFLGILLFVEGVIGAIGISRVLGSATFAKAIANALESIVPGPAERVLDERRRPGDTRPPRPGTGWRSRSARSAP